MADTIPVIDVADYLAGRVGALEATARQVHDALTTVGFLVLTGHDVPRPMIDRTFAGAKRLHDRKRQPLAAVFSLGQRPGARYFDQCQGSRVSIWRIG
jgi:isopenicillin N synthase-like dioxygenase